MMRLVNYVANNGVGLACGTVLVVIAEFALGWPVRGALAYLAFMGVIIATCAIVADREAAP